MIIKNGVTWIANLLKLRASEPEKAIASEISQPDPETEALADAIIEKYRKIKGAKRANP